MKNNIDFNTFMEISNKLLDIKIGTIIDIERIPKNNKMVKITVNFGDCEKISISNIGGLMEDITTLKGKNFPFVLNLEPAMRNGFLSEAMILADVKNNNMNLELSTGYDLFPIN